MFNYQSLTIINISMSVTFQNAPVSSDLSLITWTSRDSRQQHVLTKLGSSTKEKSGKKKQIARRSVHRVPYGSEVLTERETSCEADNYNPTASGLTCLSSEADRCTHTFLQPPSWCTNAEMKRAELRRISATCLPFSARVFRVYTSARDRNRDRRGRGERCCQLSPSSSSSSSSSLKQMSNWVYLKPVQYGCWCWERRAAALH